MHDEDVIVSKTYKRVWRLERFFYNIERFKLPRPVTFSQLGYFFVGLVIVFIIQGVAPFLLAWMPSSLIRYLGLPFILSWYLSKKKHDGKAPHKWLWVQFKYHFSPKYITRYKYADKPGVKKYTGTTSIREWYTVGVTMIPSNSNNETEKKKRKSFIKKS
jgi:hypothetical protein